MAKDSIEVEAPAKVNLTLEVLGRRDDGYHELCSVMQALSLADRLTFEPSDALRLHCTEPALEGPGNLVWRAAELLRRHAGIRRGAAITLHKQIPVAAGLGGGSSDAAATLRALAALWDLHLPPEALADLGAQVGSDVPFFLGPAACALVEGRGERVRPLPLLPARWVVLLKPPTGIATGEVYRAFPPARWADGRRTGRWLAAAAAGEVPAPFNDLEPVALEVAPAAAAARDALLAAGAPHAVLSGSGSAYFALFTTLREAERVRAAIPPAAGKALLARFLQAMPAPHTARKRGSSLECSVAE